MLEKTAEALGAYKEKRLAVALSGGRDSTCLLHAVINCGAVDRSQVIAVHVNHMLRETAARDEAFVRGLCEKFGVKLLTFSVDVNAAARENGLGIEQAARNARYGILRDVIKHGYADVLLTAHHALDNTESVLMHLFRGSGLDGLCGMAAGDVVRPFIGVYPDELDLYVKDNALDYVVDETNFDDGADRNFIRLNILPLIEKRYAGAVRAVNALADECKAAVDILDGLLDCDLIRRDRGATVIADAALRTPLAARYVRKALCDFTLTDMTRAQIESVVALESMRTGAAAQLSHGVVAARETCGVALYIPREKYEGERELVLGANYIDGLVVDVQATDAAPELLRGCVVDGDKLRGATVRFRRDGDVFKPFGGKTKKLKQYFIDSKIPARLRDRIALVCRGSEVLVAVGVQISDSVRVCRDTVNKLAITLR